MMHAGLSAAPAFGSVHRVACPCFDCWLNRMATTYQPWRRRLFRTPWRRRGYVFDSYAAAASGGWSCVVVAVASKSMSMLALRVQSLAKPSACYSCCYVSTWRHAPSWSLSRQRQVACSIAGAGRASSWLTSYFSSQRWKPRDCYWNGKNVYRFCPCSHWRSPFFGACHGHWTAQPCCWRCRHTRLCCRMAAQGASSSSSPDLW
mmetsp:Transcript_2433/g.6759  ORF Transcript_2433/g.6759 Transcript_2433/m.6759 type:complete len:204 (+) Transcript_2433:2225-2836(+)